MAASHEGRPGCGWGALLMGIPADQFSWKGDSDLSPRMMPGSRLEFPVVLPSQHDTAHQPTPPHTRTHLPCSLRNARINARRYYLVVFLDEYSRYVVHHELMCYLDGETLSLAAQRAIETLGPGSRRPVIQSDNGSNYISGEFKQVLAQHGLSHVRIRPHCPEENGLVERLHRTLAEALDDHKLRDLEQARELMVHLVRWYNEERLHSALQYLRPIDYYRGYPVRLLEERRRKLAVARHQRRERNLELRQPTFAFEAMDSEVRCPPISSPICPT